MLRAIALYQLVQYVSGLELNATNFDSHVGGRWHMLVDFYAPWCDACAAFAATHLKAVITTLKSERADVRLGRVNGDTEGVLRTRFKIVEAPSLVLMRAGQPADPTTALRYDGALETSPILEWARRALGPSSSAPPRKTAPLPSVPPSSPNLQSQHLSASLERVPSTLAAPVTNSSEEELSDTVHRHANSLLAALLDLAASNGGVLEYAIDSQLRQLLERRNMEVQKRKMKMDVSNVGNKKIRSETAPADDKADGQEARDLSSAAVNARGDVHATGKLLDPEESSSSLPTPPQPKQPQMAGLGASSRAKLLEKELDAILGPEEFNLDELDAILAPKPQKTASRHAVPPDRRRATDRKHRQGTSTVAGQDCDSAHENCNIERTPRAKRSTSRQPATATATLQATSDAASAGGGGGAIHTKLQTQTVARDLDALLGPLEEEEEEGYDLGDELLKHREELFPNEPEENLPPRPEKSPMVASRRDKADAARQSVGSTSTISTREGRAMDTGTGTSSSIQPGKRSSNGRASAESQGVRIGVHKGTHKGNHEDDDDWYDDE